MRFVRKLFSFFFPSTDSTVWRKLAPYGVVSTLFVFTAVGGTYTWEYTNSTSFCGTACHDVHPPQYTTYLQSPHAQVKCVECHIGRSFVGNQLTRKIGDVRHVTAEWLSDYEFPLHSYSMRPAEEVCEKCHSTEKFSDKTFLEIIHYQYDELNSPITTYLNMNTGGGLAIQGQGKGIHWHIENTVLFYPADEHQQEIPYVKVIDEELGISTEYLDYTSSLDPFSIDEEELVEMDCVTCHNRISHTIYQPDQAVDKAITKQLISASIPEIKAKAVEALSASYDSSSEALNAISRLGNYYQEEYPVFYELNSEIIIQTVETLKDIYTSNVFPEQKVDWTTYTNNLGHQNDAGCFRCHDGKHFDLANRSIRVECNLCHSLPVVFGANQEIVLLEIHKGDRPTSHDRANWIALHTIAFDESMNEEYGLCSECHDVTAYDTGDNVSFCSNSACHGSVVNNLDFEVFQAPELYRTLLLQLPHYPRSLPLDPEWHARNEEEPETERFYLMDVIHAEAKEFIDPEKTEIVCEDCHASMPPISPAAREKCIACHGETEAGWTALTEQFESNPHDGHYGAIGCYTCHQNFGPYENPCALCHEDIEYKLKEGYEPE